MSSVRSLLFLTLLPSLLLAAKIRYSVQFIGIDDPATLKSLRSVSDLSTLQDKPPASINALKYRADSDIPELMKVLHAHGYYEAIVNIRIEEQDGDVQVFVMITPGPVYSIEEFSLKCQGENFPKVSLSEIGIELGKPAEATKILNAEQKTLFRFAERGYPLAKIDQREMIADGKKKAFIVRLDISPGPFCRFGPVTVQGEKSVKQQYVLQKTAWKEGDPYDSSLVEKTQKNLMESGLFSSALITHGEKPDDAGLLAMRVEVNENKHRNINLGVSYQTFFGPGVTFGWEDRNIDGLGRRLTLQGDATRKTHSGLATYYMPDFFAPDQDFVLQAQAMHESIFTYSDQSYNLTSRFEKRIDTLYRFSFSVKLERLIVKESVDNGTFTLLELPLYFRFSSANDLLDPTKGHTLEYKIIPSDNFSHLSQYYLYQMLAFMTYWPVTESGIFVIAQQAIAESIVSKDLDAVPVPKRVLGGTDQELRGYRYRTVSPLEGHHPIGGRSGLFYTLEARLKVSKKIGLVPFFDIGNVYLTQIPKFDTKWFKSVGLGLRYFSFLGPLRFDIAFPLERRKGIDPRYRVLVSLGQTF